MALPVEEKFKIYSILQMNSSSISMLASATLMFMIFRSHKKLSTPLHRLLLGLAISDFIASLAMSFASILSPPDNIGWNASGNMTLCRTQAFIQFWGQNTSLSRDVSPGRAYQSTSGKLYQPNIFISLSQQSSSEKPSAFVLIRMAVILDNSFSYSFDAVVWNCG